METLCAPCDVGTKVSKKALRHMSVCPHVTQEPVNGFSRNVLLRNVLKFFYSFQRGLKLNYNNGHVGITCVSAPNLSETCL